MAGADQARWARANYISERIALELRESGQLHTSIVALASETLELAVAVAHDPRVTRDSLSIDELDLATEVAEVIGQQVFKAAAEAFGLPAPSLEAMRAPAS